MAPTRTLSPGAIPKRFAVISAVLLLAGCGAHTVGHGSRAEMNPIGPWQSAALQDHPLAGRIWVPGERRFITPDGLLSRLASRRFVLLGERHDNPDHHRVQAWITRRMIGEGRRPALAMEMFRRDQQPRIDAHLEDNPGDSAGLGRATGWSRSGWPPWQQYEAIVRPIVTAELPLVAANLARGEVRAVIRRGLKSVGAERLRHLGLERPLSARILAAIDREIADSHCGMVDAARSRPFTHAQLLRDATLAAVMRRAAATADGAVLIAGAGHARKDRGVPYHLRRTTIGATEIFSLGIVEVVESQDVPATYGAIYGASDLPFDAVWFTPRQEREDPCEAFRSMRKKRTERK
ncbi:MAG: ChaN family lipoprotein [Alphaproteobacteria bacterium]|nr:ChaN family lipoprotein [Alphaproteobacteria bacterium]